MKSLLFMFALTISVPTLANDHYFVCEFNATASPMKERATVQFKAHYLSNEDDIFKVKGYSSELINGVKYYFAGAMVKYDSCAQDMPFCRMLVLIKVENGEPTVGYIDHKLKMGVFNSKAKMYCTARINEE